MDPLIIIAAVTVFGILAAATLQPLRNILDTRRRMQQALTMSKEWRQLGD